MIFGTPTNTGDYDPNSYVRGAAQRKLLEYAKVNPAEFHWRLRPWTIGVEEESRLRLFELLSESPDSLEGGVTFYIRPKGQEVLERAVDRSDLIGIRWFKYETIPLSEIDQKAQEEGFNISTRLRTKISEIMGERERLDKKARKSHRIMILTILGIALAVAYFMFVYEVS